MTNLPTIVQFQFYHNLVKLNKVIFQIIQLISSFDYEVVKALQHLKTSFLKLCTVLLKLLFGLWHLWAFLWLD